MSRFDHRATAEDRDRAEAAKDSIGSMTLADIDAMLDGADLSDAAQLRRMLKRLARLIVATRG